MYCLRRLAFLLILILSSPFSIQSLELKRVILSTNNDPLYIEFWPIVAPIWTEMGFRPTLALIADEDCSVDESLGDVIRFSSLPGVPDSVHAQLIRLLLPCLFPNEGCLISDIDMLPISRSYFVNGASKCPDDGLLIYRDCYPDWERRFPMCYVAGKGRCFRSLFKVSEVEEMAALIQEWAFMDYGWNTDEIILYDTVVEWRGNGGGFVCLGYNVTPRLDRTSWPEDFTGIHISDYVDCHFPRPYSAYRDSIDEVVQAVKEALEKP